MNYVNSLEFNGIDAKEIPCIKGNGAPTTATEGAVGCLYMDTATGDIYKCIAVASGAYTWVYIVTEICEKAGISEVHSANYMPPAEEFTAELLHGATAIIASSANNKLSPYFEVPSGKKFTVQNGSGGAAGATFSACRTFAAFDENKNPISVIENAAVGTIFDIPENTKYLRICVGASVLNVAAYRQTMFVVNDDGAHIGAYVVNKTELIQHDIRLNPEVKVNLENLSEEIVEKIEAGGGDITDDSLTNVSPKHKKSLRMSALSHTFTTAEYAESDFIAKEGYTGTANKCDWLYGLYDELVTTYPEYVTRTQIAQTASDLAKCYDSSGNERTGLKTAIPMYRYDFKPPISSTTLSNTNMYGQKVSLPKILYTTGIHGGEYTQVLAGYRFFKMLCEKWHDYDLLADLRWNVHFVVIPLTNPFGFEYPSGRYDAEGNSVSKRNEHNIDISGNFPSDNYVENEGSEYKYGTESLTEPESIALYNIITTEDFILSIDNHCFGPLSSATENKAAYIIANHAKENSINFWFKISRWINQRVRKMSPDIDASYDGYDMAQVWTDKRQQMLNNTFRSVGANVEMTTSIHPTDNTLLVKETQSFLVDELAVIFYEALQDFYTY